MKLLIWFTLLVYASAALGQSAAHSRAANAACGFSLKLPEGWVMHRTTNRDVPCWYSLSDRHRQDSCSMLVRTLNSDFSSAAKEAGFDRTDNQWVIHETWGETIEADSIKGPDWEGIEANHVVREVDTSGNATGTNTWVAVLNAKGNRSAIIEAYDCTNQRFDEVTQSFRFESATHDPSADGHP